ncbi:MAG: hypothetical protein IJQ47_03370 [Synergistaceae bacterium]|nr:hypothetical protein [Synergistaceae bacterium]
MEKFRFYEMFPSTNWSANFMCVDDIQQRLGEITFETVERRVREELKDFKSKWGNPNKELFAARAFRAHHVSCLWVFCAYFYYYDKYNAENLATVKNYMNEWELEEALFFEMKDIAEAY